MTCPRCRRDNPPASQFCLECGAKLALRCAGCGTELPGGAKFCNECGQPIGAAARAPGPSALRSSTPEHLAEKILTSRSTLEGVEAEMLTWERIT